MRNLNRKQIIVFLLCWLAGVFAGMDAHLFNLMLPNAIQEIGPGADVELMSQIGSTIVSLFLLGWMFGGLLGGFFADRHGRVKTLLISILLYSLSTGLASLATSFWELALFRMITGLGVGGTMISISILLAETWTNSSRAVAVGLLITSYQVGVFLSGVLGTLFSSWTTAFLAGAFPALLSPLVYFVVPESDKWKTNRSSQKVWGILFGSTYQKNLCVGSIAFGALLISYWASVSWVPTWIHSLVKGSTGIEKNLATLIHGFGAILGCFLGGFVATVWGRLPILQISFAGAFLSSIWMFLGNEHFSQLLYLQYGLIGLFIGMAQAVMYIYLPELFSTQLRATATGFCLNSGRLITAIAVLFMGSLVSFFGGYTYALLAFSCFYLVSLTATFFGQETKSKVMN